MDGLHVVHFTVSAGGQLDAHTRIYGKDVTAGDANQFPKWQLQCYGDEDITTIGKVKEFVCRRLKHFHVDVNKLVFHSFGLVIPPTDNGKRLSYYRHDLEVRFSFHIA